METFAEVRDYVLGKHDVIIDEPFLLGFECPVGEDGRKQSIFLAELQTGDGRRYLRVETPVVPLEDFDAEKCLRINLMQRVGYLAVATSTGRRSSRCAKTCPMLPWTAASWTTWSSTWRLWPTTSNKDSREARTSPENDVPPAGRGLHRPNLAIH